MRNTLIAPAVGVAVTLWPVFLLSRLGLPIASFGMPLAVALLAASILCVWRRRPVVPTKQLTPFWLVLLLALVLVGRPMLKFGFDWLSYANDDMANYVLGAQLFLDNGFPNPPDVTTLTAGSDYSLYYWYFYVPHGIRAGSEMLLALVVSVTRLSGHQAFMPLILCLHVVLVSAAAALSLQNRGYRLAALVTAALVAMSALTAFGTLAQLIAQVAGLSIAIACAVLLLRPMGTVRGWSVLKRGGLVGIVGAAVLLVYPEFMPFLGLACLGFWIVQLLRGRLELLAVLNLCGVACLTGLVLVNAYVPDVALFLSTQLRGGLQSEDAAGFVFPYFLVPSGLADFWGFQTITRIATEPWRSLGIAVGASLLVLTLTLSVVLAWRSYVAPVFSVLMLCFGALLFVRSADFGLFKLAMFVQPFALGTLALGLVGGRSGWRTWKWLPLGLVAAAGVTGQVVYVGGSSGSAEEIPDASDVHMVSQLRDLPRTLEGQRIVLDSMNVSLAKIQALYMRGFETNFPSRDFFTYIMGRDLNNTTVLPGTLQLVTSARDAIGDELKPAFFAMHDPSNPDASDEFMINTVGQPASQLTCDSFVSGSASQSILNGRKQPPGQTSAFVVQPCAEVTNHLIFIHSELGQHYYQLLQHDFGAGAPSIGMFAMENDPLIAGRSMAGVGRYLLFQVIGPSARVRLALDMTDTLAADGINALPSAAVIGQTREALPLIGRGAARVFSPPVAPQIIDGRAFIALDMGVNGKTFAEDRSGLMQAYGTLIPLDRRLLVAFGRDVSLLSDTDYAHLTPPSFVQQFPADLLNPQLEFSGVYEDGWGANPPTFS